MRYAELNSTEQLRVSGETLSLSPDPNAAFLAGEIALVREGLYRAEIAVAEGDVHGGAMWKRLAVESTLRLVWAAGDDPGATAAGHLDLDPVAVRERTARLRATDIRHLARAQRAIHEAGGSVVDPALQDGLARLADSISKEPAPSNLRDMSTDKTQRALYAQHRLASAVIHPGAAIGHPNALAMVTEMLPEIGQIAAAYSAALVAALTKSA